MLWTLHIYVRGYWSHQTGNNHRDDIAEIISTHKHRRQSNPVSKCDTEHRLKRDSPEDWTTMYTIAANVPLRQSWVCPTKGIIPFLLFFSEIGHYCYHVIIARLCTGPDSAPGSVAYDYIYKCKKLWRLLTKTVLLKFNNPLLWRCCCFFPHKSTLSSGRQYTDVV